MIRTIRCWLAVLAAAALVGAGLAATADDSSPASAGSSVASDRRSQDNDEESEGSAKKREDDANDQERIEELERKLAVLTEEFERLRDGVSTGEEAPRADESGGKYGLGPAASGVYRKRQGVSIGGYGEWIYEDPSATLDDGSPSGAKATADFLRLVLYTGYKFNDRALFNSEIEFEHASTEDDGEVSVEFAYLDFFVRPEVNVRTGLVLVPVGWINEIHEPTTFLGVLRPDVEIVILPTTWRELGAGVFGELGPITYRGYLTTSLDGAGFTASEGIRGGRQAGSEAVAEDLALSARFDYEGVPGLIVGLSAFRGGSGQGATVGGEEVDGSVTTLDVHAGWSWRGLELRGLWARVSVDDAEQLSALTGQTIGSRMGGWYVQAGYDVLAGTRLDRFQLLPFARYEGYDTQEEVPANLAGTVTGENDRTVTTLGLVFLPIPRVAVKVDYQNLDNAAGTGLDRFNVGVGFTF